MNQAGIRELFVQKKGDLSQKIVAAQAGVSQSTLSRAKELFMPYSLADYS